MLTLENSDLYNNATRQNAGDQGGAVFVNGGTLSMNRVSLYGNHAYQGGALYAINSTVNLTDVSFERNMTAVDASLTTKYNEARGGAVCIVNGITKMQRCTFAWNVSAGDAGALWILTNADNKSFEADQCSFVCNCTGGTNSTTSGMHGGAIMYSAYNPMKSYFRSCTMALNTTPSAGGALFYTGDAAGSVLNFVNCTITKNRTLTNAGNSGGVNILNRSNAVVNFVNCVVEGNLCGTDVWSDTAFGTSAHISFFNSVVGYNFVSAGVTSAVSFDAAGLYGTTPDASVTGLSSGIIPQMDCEKRCFYMQSGYAGATMADLDLAHEYGCDEDQLGVAMNRKCVGSVQAFDGESGQSTTVAFVKFPADSIFDAYSVSGVKVVSNVTRSQLENKYPAGVYIIVSHDGSNAISRKIVIE
jgi:hypothetical protein